MDDDGMRTRARDAFKRTFDVVGASLGLILVSPLLVLASLAIVLDSPGPVEFRQLRAGRNGRTFLIHKLRTMRADAPVIDRPLLETDPAITGVGRFLRLTSIDELPQLINVLVGDMSLVGPRPTVPEQVDSYDDFQRRRLAVRPGVTGWAQVSGRNSLSWDERIEHDVWYVDHRTTALDLKILALTVKVVASMAATWDEPATDTKEVAE